MSAAEDIVYTIEQLVDVIDQQWRSDIVLKDLEEKLIISEKNKAIIGVASDADPTLLLNLALNKGLKQICQFSNRNLERELNTSASMLINPKGFMSFPLATILQPTLANGAKERQLREFEASFSQAKEKQGILSQLESYLRNQIKAESLIDDIRSIADELFTNAVYNAPFVDRKSGKLDEKDRTDPTVEMPPGFEGKLFAGVVDSQLVIGCRDPFGTLSINELLKRILQCYEDGLAQSMRLSGKGGAGIGSYMVYNNSASYYIGVDKHKATIVCCSLPLNMSSKKRGQIAKNMHIFEIEGGHK